MPRTRPFVDARGEAGAIRMYGLEATVIVQKCKNVIEFPVQRGLSATPLSSRAGSQVPSVDKCVENGENRIGGKAVIETPRILFLKVAISAPQVAVGVV